MTSARETEERFEIRYAGGDVALVSREAWETARALRTPECHYQTARISITRARPWDAEAAERFFGEAVALHEAALAWCEAMAAAPQSLALPPGVFFEVVRPSYEAERRRAEELQADRELALAAMPGPRRRWFTFSAPRLAPAWERRELLRWDARGSDPLEDIRRAMEPRRAWLWPDSWPWPPGPDTKWSVR